MAQQVIQNLVKQHLITLQDAALVTWETGKKKPKTRQWANMAGLGALVLYLDFINLFLLLLQAANL